MLFPEFYDDYDEQGWRRRFVREQLEMDADEFILLLATGAAGANNHLDVLKGLEERAKSVQVVALCGHDERTFSSVESWGQRASVVRLKALRYRDDMPLILRSVSAVLARPGTGPTSEAIMSDCPLIMNGIGGIMPQESVTERYAMRHGLARTIRSAGEVGMILDAWEQNPHELHQIRENMRARRPVCSPRGILERVTDCRLVNVQQNLSA